MMCHLLRFKPTIPRLSPLAQEITKDRRHRDLIRCCFENAPDFGYPWIMYKTILRVFLLVILLPVAARAQLHPLASAPADLRNYVANATALSFMAAAVAELDDCRVPLEFREVRRDALQVLEIICAQGDEPRFARLTYLRVRQPDRRLRLIPFRIEFLP